MNSLYRTGNTIRQTAISIFRNSHYDRIQDILSESDTHTSFSRKSGGEYHLQLSACTQGI